MQRRRKRKQIVGLDGLRAIAVLGVVFYHMIPETVPGGFLGVNMFFLIMGFLMVYTAGYSGGDPSGNEEDVNAGWTLRYYQKKIRRLYPPLLAMLVISLALLMILVPSFEKNLIPELCSIVFGYNNWYQVAQNGSYFTRMLNSSPFTHLWYLGLTVQYYLLWPLLLWLGIRISGEKNSPSYESRRKILIILLAVLTILSSVEMAVLYNPHTDPSRLYYGTDTRAFALFMGMMIALIPWPQEKKAGSMIAGGILVILILVSYLLVHGESAATYRGLMFVTTLISAGLLVCVLQDQKRLGRIFSIRPLAWLGKYSYEIYLVMYPCIYFIQSLTKMTEGPAYVLVSCIVILIAAVAVHDIALFFTDRKKSEKKGFRKLSMATLVIALIVTGSVQGIVSVARGGGKDMTELETKLSENAAESRKKETDTEIAALQNSLSSVNTNVDQLRGVVASNAAGESSGEAKAADVKATVSVTMIGDSVMLGASNALNNAIPGVYIDAAVSRQVTAAPDIVNQLKASGLLGDTVIVHLGTNGAYRASDYIKTIDAIGPKRNIYWVTAYGNGVAVSAVDANIQKAVAERPFVHVLDWTSYAKGHDDWFVSDGVHLTTAGIEAYAKFIKDGTGL